MFYVLYNLAYSTRTYSKSVKMSLSCAFIKLRMTHAYKMSAHTIYSSSITANQFVFTNICHNPKQFSVY